MRKHLSSIISQLRKYILSDYAKAVGGRLREIVERSGGPTAAAEKLGIKPAQLSQYMSGYRIPGNKLRARIQEAFGEEEEFYLVSGKRFEQVKESTAKDISVRENKEKFLDVVARHGIKTAEELDRSLTSYEAMKAMMMNEAPSQRNRKGNKK